MERKFNIGDRVRFKGDYLQYVEDAVYNGGEYLITDVGHDSSEVTLHCPVFIDNDDLELVEPCDPKTAFLSELKGLLEKYGAELGDSGMCEIEGMEVTFDNGDRIRYMHTTINALNVMDYEK